MHRGALALLLASPTACVEIDPSYAESFTTTGAASTSTGAATTTADASDGSTAAPPACDCAPLELCEADACTQPARVLFVNLDGVTTTFGAPDASQDVEGLYEELAGTWDPYGADEPTRQMLLSLVAAHWAPFRVVVTDERPAAGPYLMAVVTATPAPAVLMDPVYVAFPDCGDAIPSDVTFVFASPGDGWDVTAHASFVSASLGRALGLRYSDAVDDLMGQGQSFVDACYPSSDGSCASTHPELCSDPMLQNSYAELAALLGARG